MDETEHMHCKETCSHTHLLVGETTILLLESPLPQIKLQIFAWTTHLHSNLVAVGDQNLLKDGDQQLEIRKDQDVDINACCMAEPKGRNCSIVSPNLIQIVKTPCIPFTHWL